VRWSLGISCRLDEIDCLSASELVPDRDMLARLSRTERVAKEPGLDPCIQFPCRLLQLHHQWSISGVWLVEELLMCTWSIALILSLRTEACASFTIHSRLSHKATKVCSSSLFGSAAILSICRPPRYEDHRVSCSQNDTSSCSRSRALPLHARAPLVRAWQESAVQQWQEQKGLAQTVAIPDFLQVAA
jgi:hypothetical protein